MSPPCILDARAPPPPFPFKKESGISDGLAKSKSASGAAFLRRAASEGLVSVATGAAAGEATSLATPSALSPRGGEGGPSSASLLLEGLPAPSGLVRALSGQGFPPRVELRLYRSDGSGALVRALSKKKERSLVAVATSDGATATTRAAEGAPAADAPVVAAPAADAATKHPPSAFAPSPYSAAVAAALQRGDSAELAAALLGCRLEEDQEPETPTGKPTGDGEGSEASSPTPSPSPIPSLPALFLLPPPPGAGERGILHEPPYDVRHEGTAGTEGARVFVTAAASSDGVARGDGGSPRPEKVKGSVTVSPWNDVPLVESATRGTVNMVVEIPRGTSAKFEVATSEESTPIKQDKAKRTAAQVAAPAASGDSLVRHEHRAPPPPPPPLRHYAVPIEWNYGMLPRTYEDPSEGSDAVYAAEEAEQERREGEGGAPAVDGDAGMLATPAVSPVAPARLLRGDGDPLDAVELSERSFETGTVLPVRILGAFALIDEGELDWKVLTMHPSTGDGLPSGGEGPEKRGGAEPSLADVEATRPGEVERVVRWFSTYKKLEGGSEGRVGLRGRVLGAERAADVVSAANEAYGRLRISKAEAESGGGDGGGRGDGVGADAE